MKQRNRIPESRRFRPVLEVLEDRVVPATYADFNGDGFDDLAIGVPGEDLGEIGNAGAVNIIYGTAAGLASGGDQIWTQDSEGIKGVAEEGDAFGASLAAGDFNNDGFSDLAIGVPYQDVGLVASAGAVHILYGSVNGLASAKNIIFTQNTGGILDKAEEYDLFGYTLAAGDFNGDGFDDLVVGVFTEDIGVVVDAGAVNIIYGAAAGLTATGNQFWHQNSTGILDSAEQYDGFGYALAVGYFNSDIYADLVIGVPFEGIGTAVYAGAINVIHGSAAGLTATGNKVWTQNNLAASDGAEADDYFGYALAAGDFNADGTDDLAIGAPYEDVGAIINAGAVNIMVSSSLGLGAINDQFWHQDSGIIQGTAEANDQFGIALVAADFSGDGFKDLAIGVDNDLLLGVYSGAVNVIFGSNFGLTDAPNQYWAQNILSSSDGLQDFDAFGRALAAADFNGDGITDLAVGAYGEDVGAGAVNIINGAGGGLTDQGNQTWSQNSYKIEGIAEDFDIFGYALA